MPGTVSYILPTLLTFFAVKSLFSGKKKQLGNVVFASAVLVSLFSLILTSGILAKIPQLPNYLKETVFSTFGGKLPEAIFLAIALPLGIYSFISQKENLKKVFLGAALGVLSLNLILCAYKILPGKPASPVLNPLKTSWSVAIDAIKESPILGIGPGNYLSAFTKYRPISFNQNKFWNNEYNVGRNYILTALTETGFLGLFFFGLLTFLIYRNFKEDTNKTLFEYALNGSLVVTLILLFVFPVHVTTLLLLSVLLALAENGKETSLNLKTGNTGFAASRLPSLILTVLALGGISFLTFIGQKYVRAEVKYKKSLEAVAANDAKKAYDLNMEAIKLTPRVDRYRMALSQLDIALAKGVAGKKNLTEEDKTLVTQLIQQAISEAKAGVSVNLGRSGNWEILGNIYQGIMPFAQGADNFAVQSFSQAVALNPMDPALRVSLGGLYYALGRYDDAITSFKIAASLKNDYPNAFFNLSAAYREKGDLDNAITAMKTTLSLVKEGTNDYTTAKTELENLEKRKPTTKENNAESLTNPT